MFYLLILITIVAIGSWKLYAQYRKPKPSRSLKRVDFEEALIDFTPKKGYLPMFGRNHRLT